MIPKRLATTECRKKERERGSEGEKRKRGRKRGRKAREGKEGNEGWMERERKRGRVRIGRKARDGDGKEGNKGWMERGRKGREGEERIGRRGGREKKSALGERGARSTCTLYERNPRRRRWAVVHFMHAYARLSRIPCTTPTDSSISGLRFGPICSIFYENSK